MNQDTEQKILDLLREIRDGQREALSAMEEHRSLVKEQIQISRGNVQESVDLQRLALKRQKVVTLVAVPGVIACIAAIAYLVIRYF
jgi:hypothetical protein